MPSVRTMHTPAERLNWHAIKDRIDLKDMAVVLLGEPPGRRGGSGLWWRCPLHDDRNPSFNIDPQGNPLGGGTVVPDNTAYIRRWLIEPLPTNPNNTLIIQVLVTRRRDRGTADAGSVARAPDEARLITVKTRKAQ